MSSTADPAEADPRGTLALLRAPRRVYLAHADPDLVRRVGGLALGLPAIAALGLIGLEQPFRGGALGLVAAVVLGLVGLATGAWLELRRRPVGYDLVYGLSLAGLVAIGLLGWLAADGGPYADLFIFPIVYVAAVDTWWLLLIAIAVAAVWTLPGLHGDNAAAALGVHLFVWIFTGTLALAWTAGVRLQRRALFRAREAAAALARVDALTGLGNRRAFDEAAAAELARARRTERPLSLLVGDLDDFKAINDRHGHLAGDTCLRAVAEVLSAETRRPDACFRWGGDEFVVLLPEADLERARAVAARVTDAVTAGCRTPAGRPLSVAFGAAELDGEGRACELVARADADLLDQKAPIR